MTLLVAITVALAALAVLAAIVIVAVGGGGELSTEHPDHPPLALPGRRPIGGTDVALLRLPLGLWGYHKQITDEALERFAHELTERDTRIAVLEQELAEARRGSGRDPRQVPAHGGMPVMGEDPQATRTDRSQAVPGAGDPLATRTDQGYAAPAAHGEQAPGRAHAPATDPWKTLADDPGDDADGRPATAHSAGHGADDGTADKAAERLEAKADREAADDADDVEDPRPVRTEDGE